MGWVGVFVGSLPFPPVVASHPFASRSKHSTPRFPGLFFQESLFFSKQHKPKKKPNRSNRQFPQHPSPYGLLLFEFVSPLQKIGRAPEDGRVPQIISLAFFLFFFGYWFFFFQGAWHPSATTRLFPFVASRRFCPPPCGPPNGNSLVRSVFSAPVVIQRLRQTFYGLSFEARSLIFEKPVSSVSDLPGVADPRVQLGFWFWGVWGAVCPLHVSPPNAVLLPFFRH